MRLIGLGLFPNSNHPIANQMDEFKMWTSPRCLSFISASVQQIGRCNLSTVNSNPRRQLSRRRMTQNSTSMTGSGLAYSLLPSLQTCWLAVACSLILKISLFVPSLSFQYSLHNLSNIFRKCILLLVIDYPTNLDYSLC